MKASQLSDAQKAFILTQGQDGVPVAEICRKAGISQATYFNWEIEAVLNSQLHKNSIVKR
jgi:putative transposase